MPWTGALGSFLLGPSPQHFLARRGVSGSPGQPPLRLCRVYYLVTTWAQVRAESTLRNKHRVEAGLPNASRETDGVVLRAPSKSACAGAGSSLEGSGAELCFCSPGSGSLLSSNRAPQRSFHLGWPKGVRRRGSKRVRTQLSQLQATCGCLLLSSPASRLPVHGGAESSHHWGKPGQGGQGCSLGVGEGFGGPSVGQLGR